MTTTFIPGIYNYCDRWCDRCTFTTRCQAFKRTSKLPPEQSDIHNKAFWDEIYKDFEEATQLIYKAAADLGIDLENIMTADEEQAFVENHERITTTAYDHPLSKLCKLYRDVVLPFADKNEELVNTTREMIRDLRLGTRTEEDVVTTTATIGDCLEVIQWYVFFIDAKLQRALQGRLMEDELKLNETEFPKDSDGSAKIALIAIDRSMSAWVKLHELMPSCEDVAISALAGLSRIRRLAVAEFPNALQFVRPGFDE